MTPWLGKTVGICGFALGVMLAAPGWAQLVPPLEQQLDMQTHNFERVRALTLADRLVDAGNYHYDVGRTDTAIAAWQRALELYSEIGDVSGIHQMSQQLARAYIDLDQYTEATEVLIQQISAAKTLNDASSQIGGLNNLGMAYVQQGELNQAQAAFDRALQIAEATQDPSGIGRSFSNLGLAARLQGDLDGARAAYESAIAYRLQANDAIGLAHSYNNLGGVYRQLGNQEAALEAYLTARQTALDANHIPTLLAALDGLISMYAEQGDRDQLRTYIGERVVLTEDEYPLNQRLGLFVGLGRYYEVLEDYARAEIAYEEALEIAEQMQDAPQRTFILNRLQSLALLSAE